MENDFASFCVQVHVVSGCCLDLLASAVKIVEVRAMVTVIFIFPRFPSRDFVAAQEQERTSMCMWLMSEHAL